MRQSHKEKQGFCFCLPFLFLTGFLCFAAVTFNMTSDYRQGRQEYRELGHVAREKGTGERGTGERGTGERGTGEKEEAVLQAFPSPDEENLKRRNPDYRFWIKIPGTAVDYPVAAGHIPGYYLNHTFSGRENSGGCLFLQDSEEEREEENTIVFGHNRKDGSMFGALKKYVEREFYKEHPELRIFYKGRWIRGEIFSCQLKGGQDLSSYKTDFVSLQEKEAFLSCMKEDSLYPIPVCPALEDPVITLSACYGGSKRMIVQAVLMCYTE